MVVGGAAVGGRELKQHVVVKAIFLILLCVLSEQFCPKVSEVISLFKSVYKLRSHWSST